MYRLFLAWLAILALTACASIPESPLPPDQAQQRWHQRLQQLQPLSTWSIRGRVAVFVNDEVYNLGLGWLRSGDDNRLKFEASLGQGLVRLHKDATRVELTTAEGDVYLGDNAQQVLNQTTGLNIPVEGLQSWIKGIPHVDSPHQAQLDAQGRMQSLHQDGWRINYLEYQHEQAPHPSLPRRMYLKHDALALKIVIDQWQNSGQPQPPDLFPDFSRPTTPR